MPEQFYIPGAEPAELKEGAYLNDLLPELESAVENHGGPSELLLIKSTKAYSAVFIGNLTVFRLCMRGKQKLISVPVSMKDLIPSHWTQKTPKADQKYILVPIEYPLHDYDDFLISLAGATIDRYPKEWDCCSFYMECSDAKVCIRTDKKIALACGYRKILNSGKIYYGKNRNV